MSSIRAAVLTASTSLILLATGASHAATGVDERVREPQLEALISSALASSPLIDARRGEVNAARHEIDAARWQFAPSFTTQLQQGSGASTQYASLLRADQRLYTGGRLTADLEGARARRDSSLLVVQETGLSVALQIVAAWQSLQVANGQLSAIEAYRRRLGDLNDTIGRRIGSGVSPVSEQALINARLAQSQNDLSAARAASQSARATLRKLTDGNLALADAHGSLLQAVPALSPLCADNADAELRLRDASERNPGVRRYTFDIAAARQQLESQKASLKPTVLFRVEQPVGSLPDGASRSTRASVVLEYATDAGLSALSRTRAGDDRLSSLVSQAQALRREVDQQIRAECADQANALARAAGLAKAREYTQDVLSSYTRLFLAGKRGWLDVLNAAREDFDNESAALAASSAVRASAYRMSLLSGAYELGLPEPGDDSVQVATASLTTPGPVRPEASKGSSLTLASRSASRPLLQRDQDAWAGDDATPTLRFSTQLTGAR